MNMIKAIVTAVFFLFLPISVYGYASPGAPAGFVNDFAGILPQQAKAELEQSLTAFAAGENPEIVIATIKTLDGDPIEDYANRLFREWGIGSKKKNNGVLFLIVPEEKKMRIEVGYGLEGALTDLESRRIQEEHVRPLFREGRYDDGVRLGAQKIQEALAGELETQVSRKKQNFSSDFFLAIYLFLMFGISWLASVLGRSKSWWAGGVLGGVVGAGVGFFTGVYLWIAGAALLGLAFDYFVSKNYRQHSMDHNPAWWAGGGWGGWDRWGGGGFGGFGGGSSGGGGSSSSW